MFNPSLLQGKVILVAAAVASTAAAAAVSPNVRKLAMVPNPRLNYWMRTLPNLNVCLSPRIFQKAVGSDCF